LPAVVVPSGSKTGVSFARDSREVSRRIDSSAATSPTGTISSPKRPSSCAAAARWCERSAHASCSSRVMPSSRETIELCWIMCCWSYASVSPSKIIESISSPLPIR
jgi:hypothetical protein